MHAHSSSSINWVRIPLG